MERDAAFLTGMVTAFLALYFSIRASEWRHLFAACAALFFAMWCFAYAVPPPGPLGPRHAWFAAQHSVTGTWCCDVSDGHFLADDDWREASDHYEVRIYGVWWPVPASALRDPRGGPNPTGQAIVWYLGHPNPTIFCFAPGFEE